MTFSKKTLIPALILLSGSGGAMAKEQSVQTMPSFRQVDTHQNGGISMTEAQAAHGLVEVFAPVPPVPVMQTTSICQTRMFWCPMYSRALVNYPCYCNTWYGSVNGITVPER